MSPPTIIPDYNPDDKAPKTRTTQQKRDTKAKTPKPPVKLMPLTELQDKVEELVVMGSLTVYATGFDRALRTGNDTILKDGTVLVGGSEDIVNAIMELAKANPTIRRGLNTFLTGTNILSAAMPLIAIAVAIGANHGFSPIPGGMMPVSYSTYEERASVIIEKHSTDAPIDIPVEEPVAA